LKLESLKENVGLFDNKKILSGNSLTGFDKNTAMGPCTISTTFYFLPDGFGDKNTNI
jgi:hypothetical protein